MANQIIVRRSKCAGESVYAGFDKEPVSVELILDKPSKGIGALEVKIYSADNYMNMGGGFVNLDESKTLRKRTLQVGGGEYWMPGRYLAFVYVNHHVAFRGSFELTTKRLEPARADLNEVLPDSPAEYFGDYLSEEPWYRSMEDLGLSLNFHLRVLRLFIQDMRMRQGGRSRLPMVWVKGSRKDEKDVRVVVKALTNHLVHEELVTCIWDEDEQKERPVETDDRRTLKVEFRRNDVWQAHQQELATKEEEPELSEDELLDAILREEDERRGKRSDTLFEFDPDDIDALDDTNLEPDVQQKPSPKEKLEALVGLRQLKEDLARASMLTLFHKRRQDMMLEENSECRHHMLFLGNPGTGKTTVAQIIGELYHEMGLLSKGHTVMTERRKLVGEYIGATESNMEEVLDEARGGVLFIDEAYTLFHGQDDRKDYGNNVLDSLLTVLAEPNPDMIVILAGYEDQMQEMLRSNPGLRDRFPLKFHFDDFSEEELVEVALGLASERQYRFTPRAEVQLRRIVHQAYKERDVHFANARWVHNLFEQGIEKCMAFRVMSGPQTLEKWAYSDILEQDVLEAERTYLKETAAPKKIAKPRIGFVA